MLTKRGGIEPMKRILITLAAAALALLVVAGPAAAEYPPSPTETVSPTETESPPVSPTHTTSPSVLGETVTVSPGVGGTAFTGSDVAAPLALGGVLLVVGLALLYLSRRRAAADG
jgi:LPXTG-motif cell wall-anchored protein